MTTGWDQLDGFLRTDPDDVGCDEARRLLHLYVDLLLDGATREEAAARYPGVAAHLAACGPCGEDLAGVLHVALAATREGGPRPA